MPMRPSSKKASRIAAAAPRRRIDVADLIAFVLYAGLTAAGAAIEAVRDHGLGARRQR
jgi:hypothetical protein